MSRLLALLLSCLVGCVLGGVFFGGLWWTIRRGVVSKRPVLWFLGSFVLRVAIVLVGFYLVSGRQLERLVACLVGFLAARLIVTLLTRSLPPPRTAFSEETRDAP